MGTSSRDGFVFLEVSILRHLYDFEFEVLLSAEPRDDLTRVGEEDRFDSSIRGLNKGERGGEKIRGKEEKKRKRRGARSVEGKWKRESGSVKKKG